MKKTVFIPVIISVFCLLHGCADVQIGKPARITFFVGDVTVNDTPALVGMSVSSGDRISTGQRSSCDISIGESVLRIKEGSAVDLTSSLLENGSEKSDITLDHGSLLAWPKKLAKDDEFVVRTTTSVAAVRGTRFAVRTDPRQTTRIKVFEGSIRVAPRVAKLDTAPRKLLEHGTTVTKNQAVLITPDDRDRAESAVNKSLDEGKSVDEALSDNKEVIEIGPNRISSFEPSDFTETMETIDVIDEEEAEPAPVARPRPRPRPAPETLVISRYEVYKVRGGRIIEKSAVVGDVITFHNRVFAASARRVYAASSDGTILWEREIGSVEGIARSGNRLEVRTASGTTTLSLANGSTVR
ncbi:MAG: FecR domain-containing protein [Spirochaetota bacterium]